MEYWKETGFEKGHVLRRSRFDTWWFVFLFEVGREYSCLLINKLNQYINRIASLDNKIEQYVEHEMYFLPSLLFIHPDLSLSVTYWPLCGFNSSAGVVLGLVLAANSAALH